jgi:hypothetical protein
MIERNEIGVLFSGEDLFTPHGRLVLELHQELMAMTLDRNWWRDAAIGKFWDDAVNEEPF